MITRVLELIVESFTDPLSIISDGIHSYVDSPIDRNQGGRHAKDDAKRRRKAALDEAIAWRKAKVHTHKYCINLAFQELERARAFVTGWTSLPERSTVETWLRTFLNQGYFEKDGRGLSQ